MLLQQKKRQTRLLAELISSSCYNIINHLIDIINADYHKQLTLHVDGCGGGKKARNQKLLSQLADMQEACEKKKVFLPSGILLDHAVTEQSIEE